MAMGKCLVYAGKVCRYSYNKNSPEGAVQEVNIAIAEGSDVVVFFSVFSLIG